MDGDPVELGVALLDTCPEETLSVAQAVDRIETITTDPRLTRTILQTAEERGVIDREETTITTAGGSHIDFEAAIIHKEGEFTCRRCGSGLSTGYFLNLDAGELGPFGSTCIRKVTGRD